MPDSAPDTKLHIEAINDAGTVLITRLIRRLQDHDASKLKDPEKSILDKIGAAAKKYGSPTQDSSQDAALLRQFLTHHYTHNRHHPEHFQDGIDGMNLIDLIEMFLDWCAATVRTENGNLYRSIQFNQGRFKMSPQLTRILMNTAEELDEVLARIQDLYVEEAKGKSKESHEKVSD